MTAPTIDEQIAYQQQLCENYQPNPVVYLIAKSILATLQSVKDAGDDVVEPKIIGLARRAIFNGEVAPLNRIMLEYIDTILAKYKRACVERDESTQKADNEFRARERLQSRINELEEEKSDWAHGEESQRERAEKAEADVIYALRDAIAAMNKGKQLAARILVITGR